LRKRRNQVGFEGEKSKWSFERGWEGETKCEEEAEGTNWQKQQTICCCCLLLIWPWHPMTK